MPGASAAEAEKLIQLFRGAEFGRRFERIRSGFLEIVARHPTDDAGKTLAQSPRNEQTHTAYQLEAQFRKATAGKRFSQLIRDYGELLDRTQRQAVGFNIFEVLGVHEREVKTHSAFLRMLLNPYATHGQGFLFLRTFVEQCRSLKSVSSYSVDENNGGEPEIFPDIPVADIEANDWLVSREYPAKGHGRLDILIRSEGLEFLCVIENKIYAREDKDQLKSYRAWLNAPERKNVFKHRALLFLTPCGRESDFPDGTTYFPVSYQKLIDGWLTSALKELESPILEAIIQQYLATIDRITAGCNDE